MPDFVPAPDPPPELESESDLVVVNEDGSIVHPLREDITLEELEKLLPSPPGIDHSVTQRRTISIEELREQVKDLNALFKAAETVSEVLPIPSEGRESVPVEQLLPAPSERYELEPASVEGQKPGPYEHPHGDRKPSTINKVDLFLTNVFSCVTISTFSDNCSVCKKRINDLFIVKIANLSYHTQCFRCSICQADILSKHFCLIDSYPYCDKHLPN